MSNLTRISTLYVVCSLAEYTYKSVCTLSDATNPLRFDVPTLHQRRDIWDADGVGYREGVFHITIATTVSLKKTKLLL